MEDSLSSQGGQYGFGSAIMNVGNVKPGDDPSVRPQYSMPGILHFLQTEWARFEMERAQWEVERAEFQGRIAFLQGERKGQENLKQDLVRRIKMLEFALKQERAKYHKLKFGTEINPEEIKPPNFEKDEKDSLNQLNQQHNNVTWKHGRQLLRQYLQEIGYTDTIIDVRSARVRQLLGIQGNENIEGSVVVNGDIGNKRAADNQGRKTPAKKGSGVVDRVLNDAEKSVMATFDFLNEQVNEEDDEEENLSDGDMDEDDEERETRRKVQGVKKIGNESMAGMDEIADPETEAAMAEFDFLVSEGNEGAGEAQSGENLEWEEREGGNEVWDVDKQLIIKLTEQYKKERGKGKKGFQRPKGSDLKAMLKNLGSDNDDGSESPQHAGNNNVAETEEESGKGIVIGGIPGSEDDALEAALGLGELAGLTISNEAENAYDINGTDINAAKEAFRKTWNAKYTLRSHFDAVRALAFHPVEPVLLTASEDHTLKLWNLQKTVPAKKTVSLDVEPVYTFRAHTGPVLCLAVNPTGEMCYSGGMDSSIRCWNIPNFNIDPYDSFDPGVLQETLVAHTDSVWGLSIHSSKMQLLSCSADGTVRLWEPGSKSPLLNTFRVEEEEGVPTSVDFVRCEPSQMVAVYTSSNAYIYDIETSEKILLLDSKVQDIHLTSQINRVISHPTLPVTITAHNDRQIRFFDNKSGKMIHSMVAHLDAVTSLAIDPNGLYLLSGSHDCSIRLWNLDTRTCVQEITSHRKKFEESIHDVAFHPSKPYIASAGADAFAKVFV